MFSLFKKRDPKLAMEKRYKALLAEAHRLSTTDRKASDRKAAEADELRRFIDRMAAE